MTTHYVLDGRYGRVTAARKVSQRMADNHGYTWRPQPVDLDVNSRPNAYSTDPSDFCELLQSIYRRKFDADKVRRLQPGDDANWSHLLVST